MDLSILKIPRALAELEPLVLDMSELRNATSRIQEVAFVNAARAPELMAAFNLAYLSTSRYVSAVSYELQVAKQKLGETRAIVMLDKVPVILKERGLATAKNPLGSEDLRQAVLDLDPDFRRLTEVANNLKCYLTMLEEMKQGFYMAFDAVKKILAGSFGDLSRQNLHLPITQTNNTSTPIDTDFFGSPK